MSDGRFGSTETIISELIQASSNKSFMRFHVHLSNGPSSRDV